MAEATPLEVVVDAKVGAFRSVDRTLRVVGAVRDAVEGLAEWPLLLHEPSRSELTTAHFSARCHGGLGAIPASLASLAPDSESRDTRKCRTVSADYPVNVGWPGVAGAGVASVGATVPGVVGLGPTVTEMVLLSMR